MVQENSVPTNVIVGVLALQGGFSEHISHLHRCVKKFEEKNGLSRFNFKIMAVRTVSEIETLDGIVFPGGETTAMSILLEKNNKELLRALQHFVKVKPVFGTCAGLIMLSNTVNAQMEMGQLKVKLIFETR